MSKKSNNCTNNTCEKKCSIGGQALIEGIMMRGPALSAMAVRNPEGEIVLEKWENKPVKSKVAKLPLIRGVVNFIVSMKAGYKALMRSAEIAGLEEVTEDSYEEVERESVNDGGATTTVKRKKDKKEKKDKKDSKDSKDSKGESVLMTVIMLIATVLGVGLAILLFIMLPTFLFGWVSKWIPALTPDNAALASLIKSAFEGVLKIVILVAYMLLVSLMKDIRRTFQYHGAEHKTIFCYEHGKELTVENVRKEGRFHPRCGTSFLILMLLVGMLVGFFIDPLSLLIFETTPPTWLRAILKLILFPLTMGLGYELIRFAGKHDNLFTRITSAPGKWMQRITVFEPSDDMIECAILAFKEVLPPEEKPEKTETQ